MNERSLFASRYSLEFDGFIYLDFVTIFYTVLFIYFWSIAFVFGFQNQFLYNLHIGYCWWNFIYRTFTVWFLVTITTGYLFKSEHLFNPILLYFLHKKSILSHHSTQNFLLSIGCRVITLKNYSKSYENFLNFKM